MIEVHGWITFRERGEDHIGEMIKSIRSAAETRECFYPKVEAMNGIYYTSFTLFANRKEGRYRDLVSFCRQAASYAPGGQGLVCLHDDEDQVGNENRFQVFALSRGAWRRCEDPFLSPIIPTIEDSVE